MIRGFTGMLVIFAAAIAGAAEPARMALFEVDASPPVGSPMAYDPTKAVELPLLCKGIILVGDEQPIVLCAVDWIGIGNAAHRALREQLAKAVGTTPERVAVHVLHQHDAPWCDFTVDELVKRTGLEYCPFDSGFARDVFRRAAAAAAEAKTHLQPITHIGLSTAVVEKVASNRRILGPDGKVLHVRYTATKDLAIREFPEGLVDPLLRMITLFSGDKPLVALTWYATHPQSYYRTGLANPDFPGIARNQQQKKTGVPHLHFNGAGGNIGAGKYNDGAHENRQVLADRVAAAMQHAWDSTKKSPLSASQVGWKSLAVNLPAGKHLDDSALSAMLADASQPVMKRFNAANQLVWLRRMSAGDTVDLGCLRLGDARMLSLPGELFVEYQLAAQKLRPDLFVAMAAYGDYGPGYIGTAIGYTQGGYETGPDASAVAPEVEGVLMSAIAKLLEADPTQIKPLP